MTAEQIFAAINEALEQGATWKEEQLQQRIKELEEREGKFAEWASGRKTNNNE